MAPPQPRPQLKGAPPPPPANHPSHGANSAPTPAPRGGAHPPPRTDLLSAIQHGKELRKVDPNEPLPDLKSLNPNASKTLVDTLAAAMAARRGVVEQEEEEEEEDESETWSD